MSDFIVETVAKHWPPPQFVTVILILFQIYDNLYIHMYKLGNRCRLGVTCNDIMANINYKKSNIEVEFTI